VHLGSADSGPNGRWHAAILSGLIEDHDVFYAQWHDAPHASDPNLTARHAIAVVLNGAGGVDGHAFYIYDNISDPDQTVAQGYTIGSQDKLGQRGVTYAYAPCCGDTQPPQGFPPPAGTMLHVRPVLLGAANAYQRTFSYPAVVGPVKIVSLGHRSGAVIMVRTDSAYQKFSDLRGKRIAIPSRFAVDFLFLRKMLSRENMVPADIEIMEMPPPDMPAALYANAVDAYCTGEPFGASAQRAGYARVLSMTRDEWRNYICCCLTVREELIAENPAMIQDLVNHVQGAGAWLDEKQENRDKAVAIAAGKGFFNQDPNILRFVMENPTDRVTYGDLRMIREEFDELMQLSIQAGTIKHPIAYETYIDERFVRAQKTAVIHL
jgi:ABC-type nitrate/sulfonate/bicarbonate transport system substrate-binding protein